MKDKKWKLKARRGSSLLYLVISMVLFTVSFGLLYMLLPMVVNALLTVTPPSMTAAWTATNVKTQNIILELFPLVAALGLTIFAVKTIMVATRGGGYT